MTSRIALLALVCVGASGLVFGQAETPPSQDTSPRTPNETAAPGKSTSRPSDASSPHQRQATNKEDEMKGCIAKERSQNSGMSKEEAKKVCKEQMKSER
jgi:hypothetical protein